MIIIHTRAHTAHTRAHTANIHAHTRTRDRTQKLASAKLCQILPLSSGLSSDNEEGLLSSRTEARGFNCDTCSCDGVISYAKKENSILGKNIFLRYRRILAYTRSMYATSAHTQRAHTGPHTRIHVHTQRTHARTHSRIHAHTHAFMHARTHERAPDATNRN